MKKLMIAAVAMAGAAAFGGLCDTIVPGGSVDYGCRAYDFKASVKLVDGKKAKVPAGNICSDDGTAYYRVAATRKLKGVLFDCDTCNVTNAVAQANPTKHAEALLCGGDQTANYDFAHFYLSTSASKYKTVSHTDDAFGDKYGAGSYNGSLVYDFKILNFFGAASAEKAKKAEALLALDFVEFDQFEEYRVWSILCAGFGAQANGLVKNLCGNVAGAVSAATWCGIPTVCFEPCGLDPNYDSIDFPGGVPTTHYYDVTGADIGMNTECLPWTATLVDAIASYSLDAVSGTWSLKYNKSESRAAYGSTVLNKMFGSGWNFIENKGAWSTYKGTWQGTLVVKSQN